MVRVISVHHFASQHIQTIEQPTASAVAPPHRLLLALSSHCIEVRDLNAESDVLFTFPTVDQVTKLQHCLNGNYVLTVETKYNRQNREMNYIRVYVNWDSVATLQQSKMTNSGVSLATSECGMVQPMRARIAGRVTPTSNQSELCSLEMIEMPVIQNPTSAACCQISGNILIQTGNSLTFYTFIVKTHDISKLKFIDFEEMPFYMQLCFAPTQILFAENYVACLKADSIHMFRITGKDTDEEHRWNDDMITRCTHLFKTTRISEDTIDYEKLIEEEQTHATQLITVNLPTIVKSNSLIHRHSPFTFIDKEMAVTIKTRTIDAPIDLHIENLVQLKLKPILIENAQNQLHEEFKSLTLKPLYTESVHRRSKTNAAFLRSVHRDRLHSVICLIATQQEGYLYQIPDFDAANDTDHCISVYPFTAPVTNVVLEDNLLHALTDTGLESYTVRIGHKMCQSEVLDNLNSACPSIDDSFCLVGLRPFLGIERMILSDSHLILMASADNSPTHSIGSSSSSTPSTWTLYTLELPKAKTVFNDISIVANNHRFTSPQTYCHLMSEAHMIVRISLMLTHWMTIDVGVGVAAYKQMNDLYDVYRNSCALLGDHYVMCNGSDEYKLAVPYYRMAGLKPTDVLKRVMEIHVASKTQTTIGLVNYLKVVLSDLKFRTEVDMFLKSAWTQSFVDEILTIFEKNNARDLPLLVLKNHILREYSTNRFTNILSQQPTYEDALKETEKLIALTLLYLQRGNTAKAEETLKTIEDEERMSLILMDSWELLFDSAPLSKPKQSAFSDFSILLMSIRGSLLSRLLVQLFTGKKVSLNRILKIFLEYLPSRIGSDGNTVSVVLQGVLELYFKSYFSSYETKELQKIMYDKASHEAMKILVRLYLSQLQMMQVKETNSRYKQREKDELEADNYMNGETPSMDEALNYNQSNHTQFPNKISDRKPIIEQFLFERLRFEYLERMPPFQLEITSKLYEALLPDYVPKISGAPNEAADLLLMKLQAILCSQAVPKQVSMEADAFLSLNENLRGFVSLKSILMEANDALLLLIEECPQCLLQFAKDRLKNLDQWRFLISALQRKIQQLDVKPELKRICFFYKKILKDVLTYCATTMTIDNLQQALPPRATTTENDLILDEIFNYGSYITICKETAHANQIKKLIVTTGQQLLTTLNL